MTYILIGSLAATAAAIALSFARASRAVRQSAERMARERIAAAERFRDESRP